MQDRLGLVKLLNVTFKIRLKIHEKKAGIVTCDRIMWQIRKTEVDSDSSRKFRRQLEKGRRNEGSQVKSWRRERENERDRKREREKHRWLVRKQVHKEVPDF